MSQTRSLVLLAGAALSLGCVNAVQAQQSTDEVRSMVQGVLSDAESRSSLLAGGDAGHDGKFFIAGDGFRLNVQGLIQFRYYLNVRDRNETNNEINGGFQTARTQLNFNGEINKDWFFRVQGNFGQNVDPIARNSDGGFGLEYAYAGYRFANGAKAMWGQFKLPLLHEDLVGDGMQLAVDRGIVSAAFGQGYSQGIQVSYEKESWRLMGAVSDGLNSANTDWSTGHDSPPQEENTTAFVTSGEAEYALTARFEWLFSGNWKMFDDFTAEKGQDFGAYAGAAVHWQQSPDTSFAGDIDRNTLEYTVDGSLEGDSWNLYAAFVGRYAKRYGNGSSVAGVEGTRNDFGWVVQGGWRFAQYTEAFARYEGIDISSKYGAANKRTFHFVTVGLNEYYAGHAAKATVDLVWALTKTTDLENASGVLPNTQLGLIGQPNKANEVCLRFQFQLLF